MTGGPLTSGAYRLHLSFLDPARDGPGQRVLDLELRGSHRGEVIADRVDVSQQAGKRYTVVSLTFPVDIDQGFLDVRLTPVRGKLLLCAAILEAEELRPPEPIVRKRTDAELPITAVTASASVSAEYSPQQTIDLDRRTRWAALGDDHWIQYDLGRPRRVTGIAIAWFNGDQRRAKFELSISLDGAEWRPIFSGESSGTTLALEAVDIDPVEARYLRVECHGNSANAWNSITEIAIHGE